MKHHVRRFSGILGPAAMLQIPCGVIASAGESLPLPAARYNVLFIAVDDLNDWVGCFGGNPQAITPNLDRLARQRAMVMSRAYCPSTVCCPSRSSLLTGRRPTSTGVYGNEQNSKNAAKAKDVVTLPEYFGKIGYVDCCLGDLLDALEKGRYADNTVVMLWRNHGWHLSEKMKYGRSDLWKESARVPFFVRFPGTTQPGFKCGGAVNLIDMYPHRWNCATLSAQWKPSFAKRRGTGKNRINTTSLNTHKV